MISHSVLTFDFGLRHTGVAIGQAITGTARGIMTLKCNDGQPQWHEIRALVETYAPTSLVVGLPLHMDGEESEMSSRVRAFPLGRAGTSALTESSWLWAAKRAVIRATPPSNCPACSKHSAASM